MSDSLVTKDALVAPSEGQAQGASGQAQSNTDGQTSNGQSAQDDNIRNLQSKLDKQIAASQREAAAARQEAAAARQHAQALQQRLQAMEDNSAPDDYARMELRLKRAEETAQQYAATYQQVMQERQAAEARDKALSEVADEFGVSKADLAEATDYVSAVKLALKAQQSKEQRKQQDNSERAERNRPDVGGGAPRTASSQWQADYADAVARRDTVAQMRLLRTRGKE